MVGAAVVATGTWCLVKDALVRKLVSDTAFLYLKFRCQVQGVRESDLGFWEVAAATPWSRPGLRDGVVERSSEDAD